MTNAVPESEIIERLMNIDMPKEKVVTAIHAANVLITLVNVPEIYTRCKIHDYIIKEYNNTFSNGITNELIKKGIKYDPFCPYITILNFQDTSGYFLKIQPVSILFYEEIFPYY